MLKTIQLPPSSYLITYYQTLEEFIGLLRQENLKREMFLNNLKKIANFIKKFLIFEMLNCCSNFLSDREICFLALENGQKLKKNDKNFRKP